MPPKKAVEEAGQQMIIQMDLSGRITNFKTESTLSIPEEDDFKVAYFESSLNYWRPYRRNFFADMRLW